VTRRRKTSSSLSPIHPCRQCADHIARREARSQAAENETEAAAPLTPLALPPADVPEDPTTEKIDELAKLHTGGAITDDEFAAAKAKALGID
jgi:hypothetical protein